jgi:hypothetical protein
MMGEKAPETCWATNKRQVINLWNFCSFLLIYLNRRCRVLRKINFVQEKFNPEKNICVWNLLPCNLLGRVELRRKMPRVTCRHNLTRACLDCSGKPVTVLTVVQTSPFNLVEILGKEESVCFRITVNCHSPFTFLPSRQLVPHSDISIRETETISCLIKRLRA